MNGKKIKTIEELSAAVGKFKAVTAPKLPAWKKPRPAAFMIHLPGIQLLRLFRAGMYVYVKPNKEREESK